MTQKNPSPINFEDIELIEVDRNYYSTVWESPHRVLNLAFVLSQIPDARWLATFESVLAYSSGYQFAQASYIDGNKIIIKTKVDKVNVEYAFNEIKEFVALTNGGVRNQLQKEYDDRRREQNNIDEFLGNLNLPGSDVETTRPAVAYAESSATHPTINNLEEYNFHPKVVELATKYFNQGDYWPAILATYIGLINAVKAKSGRHDLDNAPLMQHVFSQTKPLLKLSDDKDEQQGFMWLFSGAATAIRNPRAHKVLDDNDRQNTFETLALASRLFRLLDEATVIDKPDN